MLIIIVIAIHQNTKKSIHVKKLYTEDEYRKKKKKDRKRERKKERKRNKEKEKRKKEIKRK